MTSQLKLKNLLLDLGDRKDLKLLGLPSDLERFSKDFFNYSPILTERLKNCSAQLVVRPYSVEAVIAVSSGCQRHSIPLTLRGAGTGNYGQCVPLEGGVVMLMSDLRKIRDINPETGEVVVEAGCLLRDLNKELAIYNRQLRLLPSTWRSSSVGGFIAGGSGGIGSVRWGFLRDPGHLLGLEVVTAEASPQRLQLDQQKSQALNHAYGTNGIITALKLATTPLVPWQEVVIDCKEWDVAVELLQSCSKAAIDLFLCSLLDQQIVESLPDWSGKPSGSHRLLILVAPDGLTTLKCLADSLGAILNHLGPENERSGQGLRELSWNHTTLHMRALDSSWTYLQMLLPKPEIDTMEALKGNWGDNLLWHLESVRQQGSQRIAALPLVRWQGEDLMAELINECKSKGAIIFNPHVITVEDGGLGAIDVDQVYAKRSYDPTGILNPGKLRGWSN